MKKIFLLLPLIVCGCAEQTLIQTDGSSVAAQRISHSSDLNRSEKCADIQKYKIFQVLNDGALAFACEIKYGQEICLGLVAYIPKNKGSDYYDDMIIEPTGGQCITYDGVFKYSTKGGYKTVPKLKFVTE